jgi:hypothetical protein
MGVIDGIILAVVAGLRWLWRALTWPLRKLGGRLP